MAEIILYNIKKALTRVLEHGVFSVKSGKTVAFLKQKQHLAILYKQMILSA